MKRLNGYDKAVVYQNTERLPVGGYVLKVLDVKYQETNYGDKIVLSFDIAEGEQKDFFKRNYQQQTGEDKKWKGTYRITVPADDGSKDDEWKQNRFKTTIAAFEESNNGYHWDWDEQKLKGRLIGSLFNNKEYDFNGRHGFFTNCHSLVPVERIRSGKFDIPADTLLKNRNDDASGGYTPSSIGDDWMNIPDSTEDEGLPFN